MSKVTRRGFLTRTSVGAAAVGVMGTVPGLSMAASDTQEVDTSEVSPVTLSEPMVAHVRDFATGEVSIMSGTREFIVRDSQLVARLLKAIP